MSVEQIIDKIVLGDRVNLDTAPYVKTLLRVFACDAGVRQLILEIVQGLLTVLRDHGCQRLNVAAMQLCRFFVDNSEQICSNQANCIALVKYLLCYPMSVYAQGASTDRVLYAESVKPPSWGRPFHPTGQFRNWFRRRLLQCNVRKANLHLWWSWYQVKRNTPIVSDEFVDKAYIKHRQTLTRDDPCPDGLIVMQEGERALTFDPVILLEKEISAIAKHVQANLRELVGQQPSAKACLTVGQKGGGQRASVLHFLKGETLMLTRDLSRLDWFPVVRTKQRVYNALVTTYCRFDIIDRVPIIFDEPNVDELLKNDEESFLMPGASIYGICEPLKVRIISKGPGPLYWKCKPLQKRIRRALSDLPIFRLTGRPISPTDVIDNSRERYLCSVDYSEATDGSSQRLGMRILEAILYHADCGLNLGHVDACRAAFGPHRLTYPNGLEPAVQKNGQLMGSIMSFPILCLLNLATLRVAEQITGYKPVDPLINGDDMFYSCPDPLFWKVQCSVAAKAGLKPSLGKCYLSEHCFSMNSVAYHRGKDLSVTEVPYFPVGLLHGKHKVAGRTDIDDGGESNTETLAGCLELVQRGSWKMERSRPSPWATLRFLAYNQSALNRECRGRNIFIPCWLGGLGQRPPPNFKVRYSSKQLSRCRRRIKEHANAENGLMPLVGPWIRGATPLCKYEPIVYHWTAGNVFCDVEADDGGGLANRRCPVWLRKFQRLQPVSAAVSGFGGQVSQKGARAKLNTSVPSSARLSAPECRETARESHLRGSAEMYSPMVHHMGSLINNAEEDKENQGRRCGLHAPEENGGCGQGL